MDAIGCVSYLIISETMKDRNVLLLFFKIMHNMVPGYLQELKPESINKDVICFAIKNDLVEQTGE